MKTEVFNTLSKREKKILVAKDVIKSIKKGQYIATQGTYLDVVDCEGDDEDDIKKNSYKLKECKVCAIGSALISTTKFANKLTFGDLDMNWMGDEKAYDDSYDSLRFHGEDWLKAQRNAIKTSRDLLSSVFSRSEISLMEACFEGGCCNYASTQFKKSITDVEKEQCRDFHTLHDSSLDEYDEHDEYDGKELLLNIMKIIVEKGRFTLADIKEHNKKNSVALERKKEELKEAQELKYY